MVKMRVTVSTPEAYHANRREGKVEKKQRQSEQIFQYWVEVRRLHDQSGE
jgi:hypothetical protein